MTSMRPRAGVSSDPGPGRRSDRRAKVVAAAMAPLLLLAACGGSSSPADGTAGSAARKGGNLTIANAMDIQTLDKTQMFHNEDIWMSEQFFDTLYAADSAGKTLEPRLATSYTLSKDKLTWTFKLRKGVQFSDGKPMTAADVAFSIDDARGKDSQWASLDTAIGSVEAKGSDTVVIKTKYPWAPLLSDLALFGNGIAPKDWGGKTRKQFWTHPIGTGPFAFQSWKKGQSVTAVRNPHYWVKGRPYLDSVTWTVVPDANTRVLQVQGGQADVGAFPPYSAIKGLKNNPNVKVGEYPSSRTDYLVFNVRRKPFDDPKVRRAISYALDRQSMVKAVLFGHGTPANALLTPALWAHDSSLKGDEFSMSKAKALLAQTAVADGFATTLTVDPGNADQVTLAQLIQDELQPLGVDVTVKKDSNATTDTETFNYDMGFSYDTTDITDPDELVAFSASGVGGYHALFTGYDNKDVNRLAKQAAHEFSQAERQRLYGKLQSIVEQEAPLVPLYYSPLVYVQSRKVSGFQASPIGYYPLRDVSVGK